MSKRVIFIEHDHVSDGGPIWHQFKARGYEITRFIIVDKEHQKNPNVIVQWPDLLTFDVSCCSKYMYSFSFGFFENIKV